MMKKANLHPLVQQNMLDKAIAYISPKMAGMRMAARAQLAMTGGYTGARVDRAALSRYTPNAGSPHTDIIRDLKMLRSRSRDQMRNAPIALGALNTTVSHTVGTGLSYSPAIDGEFLGLDDEAAEEWQDNTKRRFETWASSTDCDVERRLNFYGIQELAFRSMLESGDVGISTPMVARAGFSARLALQLFEADLISNPDYGADTDKIIAGVEVDENTGESKRVYISKRHPGDIRKGNEWVAIDIRGTKSGRLNFIHLFKSIRPRQVRGVPFIAPIIEPLKQLQRYTDAELNAAVISGLFSVFIKMDPEAFSDMFDEDAQAAIIGNASNWSGEMESGKAINLLPGESIESSNPGRPNAQFDPFWQSIMRQIGMALELPVEVLTMHFQSSYSAARAALLMAWRMFKSRRDFLSTYMCQPIFELWLTDEVASGRISAPGFFSDPVIRAAWCKANWIGDGPGSIDPTKDVEAAERRVNLGISTKDAESIAFDGRPWQEKHEQRVREINAEKQDDIYIPPAGSPAPVPNKKQTTTED